MWTYAHNERSTQCQTEIEQALVAKAPSLGVASVIVAVMTNPGSKPRLTWSGQILWTPPILRPQ